MTDLSQSGPASLPAPGSSPSASVSSPSSGLAVSHVAGGGFAGILGAVVLGVANHFGYRVSDPDALLIGSGVLSVGVGLGHVIGRVGILGAFRQLFRGSRA